MSARRIQPLHPGGEPRCCDCSLRSVCLAAVLDEAELPALEARVRHPAPYRRGQVVVPAGAPFDRLRLLRSGLLKTETADGARVTGLVLPGEIAGLESVAARRHEDDLVAVETSSVCEIPYADLLALGRRIPALQERLLARMSAELLATRRLLAVFARRTGAERLAAVLLAIAARQAARGLSRERIQLGMSGRELASYLGLAPPTLSRLLRGLERRGLIAVGEGEVRLRDLPGLEALAGTVAGQAEPGPPRPAQAPRFPRPRAAAGRRCGG